jgi:predicted HTH transcriptional regulator
MITMNMAELKELIYKGEKVDVECKNAEKAVPNSVYETYSAFANTKGGYIILGVVEDKGKTVPEERYVIRGISNPDTQKENFWNTINGDKVNENILVDDDVYVVEDNNVSLLVIHVPRADYKTRPVFINGNPYKGTYKRNHEGDYHATEHEVRAMIRDQNPDGNDSVVMEFYNMDDVDSDTLKRYRQIFKIRNDGHVWNAMDDKEFLKKLGGYRIDRKNGIEGLTLAGLLMFGTGLAVREVFSNIFMDYRNESAVTKDIRWNDRITYDGTWENNLFNFFTKVTPKLTEDIKKPFKLEGIQRVDDTPVHKAVREAFVNLIIHADYMMDAGVLKVIKKEDGFEFTNPGTLKLPLDEIYQGGNSKSRNPHMQTMLRMVGFGDNAGSGVPFILSVWKENGWIKPRLVEDTELNQVTLYLNMKMADDENVIENVIQKYENITEDFINVMEKPKKVIEKSKNVIENNVIEKNMVRLRAVMPMYSDRKLLKAANIVGTMMDNPHVSMDELKSMLNVTQRTIARYISDLKKCNVVDRVGPDKGGIWRVNL